MNLKLPTLSKSSFIRQLGVTILELVLDEFYSLFFMLSGNYHLWHDDNLITIPLYLNTMEVSFSALMIGLSGSGKTTLIRSMTNNLQQIFPTAGFNINYVSSGIKPILIYDCSGEGNAQNNWKILLKNCDSVIFVIDAYDTNHFSAAKQTLRRFIHQNKSMANKALCIMLNKSDIKNRESKQTLFKALEIDKLQKNVSKLYVKETSGFTKDGIDECFDWLSKNFNT